MLSSFHVDVVGVFVILLMLSVILIPLSHKLGLGPILPYLLVGFLVGQHGLGLLEDNELLSELGEFGVVSFLFIIGLEISPAGLWRSRRFVLGLGSLEVLLATLLFTGVIHWAVGLNFLQSLIIGMGLSLSSTAFAMSWIHEHNILKTPPGTAGLSVLLFQDMVVVLMITAVQFSGSLAEGHSVVWGDLVFALFKALAVTLSIILVFKYVVIHLIRWVAKSGIKELFTALALLLVLLSAEAMKIGGLSLALGAFLAGLMLADSQFKHALESNISPFKGLLLGFFFIIQGASINLHILLEYPGLIISLMFGLMLIKACLLYGLGRLFGLHRSHSLYYTFLLAQGGEFAYVLFAQGVSVDVLDAQVVQIANVGVALSLLVSPVLLLILTHYILPYLARKGAKRVDSSALSELPSRDRISESKVILLGAGRVGSLILRALLATDIRPIVIERDADQVKLLRGLGMECYYGDGADIKILESIGADKADAIVITQVENQEHLKVVDLIQTHFPGVSLFVRAHGRLDAMQLVNKKIRYFERESFLGSLRISEELLSHLGLPRHKAYKLMHKFERHDRNLLRKQAIWKLEHSRDEFIQMTIQNWSLFNETIQETLKQHYEEHSKQGWGEQSWGDQTDPASPMVAADSMTAVSVDETRVDFNQSIDATLESSRDDSSQNKDPASKASK